MNSYEEGHTDEELKYYEAAMDAFSDAIFVVDYSSMRLIHVNEAACRLQGQTRKELLGVDPWALVDTSRAELEGVYAEIIASGAAATPLETLRLRDDGSAVWVELRRHAQLAGDRWTITSMVRDITKRKQAEAALHVSETRFRIVFEKSPLGMAIADLTGTLLQANDSLAQMLGHTRQELIGMNIGTFTHADDLAVEQAYLKEIQAGQRDDYRMGKRYLSKLGDIIWAELLVTRIPNEQGDVNNAIGLIVDVTELKMAKAALLQSEKNYRTMVEWSPEATLVHQDGKLLYVNSAAIKMFGAASAKDLEGKQFLDLIHPDFLPLEMERLKNNAKQGGAMPMIEEKVFKVDGTIIDVESQGASIIYEGKLAVHASMRDTTERKQSESQLAILRGEMTRELERQVAIQTAAALAHEINQPLASLSALCEAARRMLAMDGAAIPTGQPDQLQEIMQRMAAESERAGGAVRFLLESLHRPETVIEECALARILQESVRIAQSAGLSGYKILINCAADLHPVWINRLQVEKVLQNLILNGVEAMQEAGNTRGRMWISADVTSEGNSACVTVRDEGPGIRQELGQQIFDPFITTKSSGMGMGLAISRTLIEAQGGKLWYEGDSGPGATFCFTLPFSR
jgi:PAS domain S-box-containing protein